ncbi:PREDICTED: dynein heavy chain 12, axonemal-like [Wasmannia auropunctata]|uniref:dynein heavy chain 12, axonemal-like n=1 Tax=Wasmannia auropunctata TaxID=64793 RepID=UPI0005EF4CD7|nr:PREDICTED: dynein heavy chain 12, axonemal-like [Wasmannia auropunctata]
MYDKYMDIFDKQMQETKDQYYETMRNMAICRIIAIKCESVCNKNLFTIASYEKEREHPSRPMVVTKFFRNRCAVAKQYYLSHRLIRNIVNKAHLLLPEIFCDFGQYHNLEFIDFDKFIESVEENLKKSAHIIIVSYYNEIVRLFSQRRYIQDIPLNVLTRFLKCATTLLGLQIITRAINTIKHLLNILADQTTIPLLQMELKCESNDLFTNPRLEEFYDAFHNLVNKIANIAHHLPSLESWVQPKEWQRLRKGVSQIDIARNNCTMFASPPDWYLNEIHQQLNVILQKSFQPLSEYLEKLRKQFGYVFHEINQIRRDITTAIMSPGKEPSFEECVAKVEDFNHLIHVINKMPSNEYLITIKLQQITAKHNLIAYTNQLRELVIDKLIKYHWNYNLKICATFEIIKERVLNVPRTTKELLELGQYMLTARSTLMVELQDKIILSVRIMSSLFEMTTLSRHHIELNNITIQWLRRIRPVLERSSGLYEQMKFELEEKLQEEVTILNARVEEMFPRLIIMNDMDDVKRVKEYIEDIRKMVQQLEYMEQKAKWINAEEALFQFPLTIYPRIKELRENILPFYSLIYRGCQWQRDREVWLNGPFEYLDVQHIENKLNQYLIDFTKINKQYKTRIKMQLAMNYPYSFVGLIDDPDPFQQPAPLKLCYQLAENVKWFKQYVPLLAVFRNSAIRQIHWDSMSVIGGYDLTPDAGTTLKKIIKMDLMEDIEKYEIISTGATKEFMHEQSLAKMKSEWDDICFITTIYKDTQVPILTQLDDIFMILEEHIIKIQAMQGSAFIKVIENEVKSFYALLLRMQSAINEWTKVQMQWMYLLPIFSSKDIVAQLPDEEILFIQVDITFRKAMQRVSKDSRVCQTAGSIGLLENMEQANILMETINAGVLNYLEKKRLFFPRFFFLSNDDMLEILSETKEPLRVQPHLKKCFEGIYRLG